MKLCKDCKHCRARLKAVVWGWEYAECTLTKQVSQVYRGHTGLEYVSGGGWTNQTFYRQCITERLAGNCGKDGHNWEPR